MGCLFKHCNDLNSETVAHSIMFLILEELFLIFHGLHELTCEWRYMWSITKVVWKSLPKE